MPIVHPYRDQGFVWLRGNLHAHTTFSDGESSIETVIAAYEGLGYDFLAISDHDLLVPPVDYQQSTSMTLLPADEVTRGGPHLLAVGIRETVRPETNRQAVIDAAGAQGGFTVLNHPSWQNHFRHYPQEIMERLTGYAGIEIYNGVVERLEGSALATDRWDRLLSTVRQGVWGFAHDDSHAPRDIGRGWNMVQSIDRTPAAICDALRQGRFYASTGVTITHIGEEDGALFVAAPDAQRIRFIGAWGKELAYVDGSDATYRFTGAEESYVRVECFGAGARAAWSQPFFVR